MTWKILKLEILNLQLDTIPEEDIAIQIGPILPGQRQLPLNIASIEEDRGDGVKVVNLWLIIPYQA